MAEVASYPHIKMHVRDESIAVDTAQQVLPLDKPLYMMRTQKGDCGVPHWYATYTEAARAVGSDTFNKRSKYFSEPAYFLTKTLVANGAFIMRLTSEDAHNARIYVECGVSNAEVGIKQWKRASNGRFMTDINGAKIPLNNNGEECRIATSDETKYTTDPEHYVNIAELEATYKATADRTTVAGKQYFYKKYDKYQYTCVRGTEFDKGMIVFKGDGDIKDAFVPVNTNVGVDHTVTWASKTEVEGETVITIMPEDFEPEIGVEYGKIEFASYTPKFVEEGDEIELGYYYTRSIPADATEEYAEVENIPAGCTIDQSTGSFYNADGEFVWSYGTYIFEKEAVVQEGELEPQAEIMGRRLMWRACLMRGEYVTSGGQQVFVYASMTDDEPTEKENYTWYPMVTMLAGTPGAWGNVYGIRLYYNPEDNSLATTLQQGALVYSLTPVELKEGMTSASTIMNGYGSDVVKGTFREDCVDPTTDLDMAIAKLVPAQYNGSYELPVQMNFMEKNWAKVGVLMMNAEIKAKTAAAALYNKGTKKYITTYDEDGNIVVDGSYELACDKLLGPNAEQLTDAADVAGHMMNPISGVDPNNIPYFGTEIVGTYDEATGQSQMKDPDGNEDIADMNSMSQIYLKDGEDGPIGDSDIELYTRLMIEAAQGNTQEYLIDYLRCPFNSIVDTGVSLATKKSYIDMMAVRDNVTVFVTPQQTWKNADGSVPKELTQFEDESVGAALRSYALLMKEDVENGTEANRCIIFLANGRNSDHDGLIASTLWIALKNSVFYNTQVIKGEPFERPNNEIDCFEKFAWTAAAEETRSRCWNAGLNYAQYADMTTIQFPSVRSVYRYDTSVLTDVGTVRAVTFCKDILREEWARWVGSKRPAEELNMLAQNRANGRISAMLNGKYKGSAVFYQTAEDKKRGYIRHVDLTLESPAQNRVWDCTIIVRREGFDPNAAEE